MHVLDSVVGDEASGQKGWVPGKAPTSFFTPARCNGKYRRHTDLAAM